MKLKLKPGVKILNVAGLLFGSFSVTLQVQLMASFTSYLLEDRHDMTTQEAGEAVGELGTVSDIAAMLSELFLGALMDAVGRKLPSVIGLFIAGTGTLLSPVPSKMAGLYVLRIITNVGVLPLLWSPYMVDYIQRESLGLLAAYSTVIAHTAAIMSSTVAI